MRIDLSLVSYFMAVAQAESLTRAADSMGVSASTVSRKIDELEHDLGIRLFERDTRHLRLTEAGHEYLHFATKAMHILDEGQQRVENYNQDLVGQLRIWCPPAFGREYMSDVVAKFGAMHPNLNISLQLEARPFELGSSEFDVGICVGMPCEGRVVVSKICTYHNSFVASPDFFTHFGIPRSLQCMAHLPIVKVFHEEVMNQSALIVTSTGEKIRFTPKLAVNDSALAVKAIMSGQYIGKIMHWYAHCELMSQKLWKTLPECTEEKSLYAVVQARKGSPLKVKMFVDFFKAQVRPVIENIENSTGGLDYYGP